MILATEFKLSYTGSQINEKLNKIDNLIEKNEAETIINTALAQAKSSGEFDGKDGVSPIVTIENFDGGYALKITDAVGTQGCFVMNGIIPEKGTDYWTEADKTEIINEVLDAINIPVIGSVDENNNIVLTGNLAGGTYTLKYESTDGSTTEIGALVVSGGNTGPTYTNLADPTSSDWLTNKRINSSKNVVDVTEAQRGDKTVVTTNFVSLVGVSKFHVKGLDIMSTLTNGGNTNNYGRYHMYTSTKEMKVNQFQPSSDSIKQYFATADYDPAVTVIDAVGLTSYCGYSDMTYMRLGGILTGAASDVIITADENIV